MNRGVDMIRGCLVLLFVLVASGICRADVRMDVELAENRYMNGNYAEAIVHFERALGVPLPSNPDARDEVVALQRRARPPYIASLVAESQVATADAVILTHLRDDPFYQPTSGRFPPVVLDRFIKVRSENRDELDRRKQAILEARRDTITNQAKLDRDRAERLRRLAALASEETVVRENSRFIAAVPFGVGQFQNGDVGLGAVFAASQGTAVVVSIATAIVANELATVDCTTTDQPIDCDALTDQFHAVRAANWISVGVTAALILVGVVEAEASFVPVTTTKRKRALPPELLLSPAGGTLGGNGANGTGGFWLGLEGQF